MLRAEFLQAVAQAAKEMDCSTAEGKELVSRFVWASKELYRIREQLAELNGYLSNPEISKHAAIQSHLVQAFSRCFDISVYLLAVTQSTLPEIFRRAGKNRTNWNFGLLKLAWDIRKVELQDKALGHLYRLAIGVAYKKGWWHPEGNNGWRQIAYETLWKELTRHKDLSFTALLEHMVENQFAYLWTAWERDFIDEIRRLERQAKKTATECDINTIPAAGRTPTEEYEQASILTLLTATAGKIKPRMGVFLELGAEMLPEIENETVSQIRERIIKEAAIRRGVSVQQARRDLKTLTQGKDADIERIKAELLSLSSPPRQPLSASPN